MEVTSDLAGAPAAHLSWGVQNLGVEIGKPAAAYVSKTLGENATAMANNYVAPDAAPSISMQPRDSSVKVGDTLSLSVAATGGGLIYQWYRSPRSPPNGARQIRWTGSKSGAKFLETMTWSRPCSAFSG